MSVTVGNGKKYLSSPVLRTRKDVTTQITSTTALPAKNDSDVMFSLQSYQGLIIKRSLVY